MRGSALPGFVMGTSTDPGKVMGRLFANGPGPRVSRAEATRLGNEVPNGAAVNATHHRITFSGKTAHLVVLASPSGGPEMTFRIAGLVNPTIEVQKGAQVSIEVVNADSDTAHGLVISTTRSASSRMPMMTAARAFDGSTLWFLGDPTSAGMHAGTLRFTAATPGIYQYLCPVPGHAQMGMVGTFAVID
jgi:rusticyanin